MMNKWTLNKHWKNRQGFAEVSRNSLGTMNVCNKFHGNNSNFSLEQSDGGWPIYAWLKTVAKSVLVLSEYTEKCKKVSKTV